MCFIERLRELSTQLAPQRDLARASEQATKNALVEPFIEFLGYDVCDLNVVRPEFGIEGGKVDYAILEDNAPIMLIECKPHGSDLDVHTSQLQDYVRADDSARFGILTDGGLYRFYSDLERQNGMDDELFLEFDMFDIQEPLAKELKRFTKCEFDLPSIIQAAYRKKFRDILIGELESTTANSVIFLLSSLGIEVRYRVN